MAITAENVRAALPVPVIRSHGLAVVAGSVVVIVGFCWLYDAFDGQGRNPPFPLGAIFPF